jgi:hypothetical protein
VNEPKSKLTLDRPVTYQISVPGEIDERWSKVCEGMVIETNNDENGALYSSLTCTLDQAALHGLLRRLYSSGIPLISAEIVPGS